MAFPFYNFISYLLGNLAKMIQERLYCGGLGLGSNTKP